MVQEHILREENWSPDKDQEVSTTCIVCALPLHLLQLACVQAANSTNGIKHVYVTLTALWKFFHYSPKRAESLKMVQS